MRVTATSLGAALLPGGVSIKPSSFSSSRHEDNYALPVTGVLRWHGRFVGLGRSQHRALATEICASSTSSSSLPRC
jgi:hypothetical protein